MGKAGVCDSIPVSLCPCLYSRMSLSMCTRFSAETNQHAQVCVNGMLEDFH